MLGGLVESAVDCVDLDWLKGRQSWRRGGHDVSSLSVRVGSGEIFASDWLKEKVSEEDTVD